MKKYEVIDNFLDKEYFDSLVTLFTDKSKKGNADTPWFFASGVSQRDEIEGNLFYMVSMLYDQNSPVSPLYNKIIPILEKLGTRCLIRVKANLYPHTAKIHEHSLHTDYDFFHSAAILSLNTCDGYTRFEDGTKVESVANRMLLFDPSEKHGSSTTTNVPARINININYMKEQFHDKMEIEGSRFTLENRRKLDTQLSSGELFRRD
tara:strand:+ start:69 stop:686 length:618 start_codon:yes stop_codon:yes gene_type:complete